MNRVSIAAVVLGAIAPAFADDEGPITTRSASTRAAELPVRAAATFWPNFVPGESNSAFILRTTLIDPNCETGSPRRSWTPVVVDGAEYLPDCDRSRSTEPKDRPFFDRLTNRDVGASFDHAIAATVSRLLKVRADNGETYGTYLSGSKPALDDCSGTAYRLKSGAIALCQDLVATIDNEDTLAFVVAHELGHAYLGHDRSENHALRRKVNTSTSAARAAAAGAVTGATVWAAATAGYYVTRTQEIREKRAADGRLLARDRKTRVEQLKEDAVDAVTTGRGLLVLAGGIAATHFVVRAAPAAWSKLKSVRIDLDYEGERGDQETEADAFGLTLMAAAHYNLQAAPFLLQNLDPRGSEVTFAAADAAQRGFGGSDRAHWGTKSGGVSRAEWIAARAEAQQNAPDATLLDFADRSDDAEIVKMAVLAGARAKGDLAAALRIRDSATRRSSDSCADARKTAASLHVRFPNNASFVRLAMGTDVICGSVGKVEVRPQAYWGELNDLTVKLDTIWRARANGAGADDSTRALENDVAKAAQGDLFEQMRVQVNVIEYSGRAEELTSYCERRLEGLDVAIVDRLPGLLRIFVDRWNLLENAIFSPQAPFSSLCSGESGLTKAVATRERSALRLARRLAVKRGLPEDAGGMSIVREVVAAAEKTDS